MDFKRDFLGIPRSSIGFQEGYPTISFGSIGIPIGFRKDFLSITRHSKGFQGCHCVALLVLFCVSHNGDFSQTGPGKIHMRRMSVDAKLPIFFGQVLLLPLIKWHCL